MIKQLPKEKIMGKLQKHRLEDLILLNIIEDILIKKRGYVIQIPKPLTPVISLMSGGLDTTIVTAILLKEFRLRVYPVYFDRDIENSKNAKKSLEYFSNFFSKKYPTLFHKPISLKLQIPPDELAEIFFITDSHLTKIDKSTNQRRGIPFQPSLYAYYSLLYALYLQETENIKVRHIIGGWLFTKGGFLYAYETLTAIRSIMLELCIMTKDFSWQFTSLPLEKDFGFCMDKKDLILWGSQNEIPMEYTWSCIRGKTKQCGECFTCCIRRKYFEEAGIKDKTRYFNQLPISLVKKH